MTKILIVGIGGVGGYFGGLLAKKFHNSEEVEVSFLARGNHLEIIKTKGLKLISNQKINFCKPHISTSDPQEIGIVDYIIVCTKSNNLEETIHQIKPCIDDKTIILPLLNGVNNKKRIQKILPKNTIAEGCVYIVSRIIEDGVVENSGNIQKLFFGSNDTQIDTFKQLENVFLKAEIETFLTSDISQIIWEKYIFLAPIATATTYYDCTIGEILENEFMQNKLLHLINEVVALAKIKNIKLNKNILEETMRKMSSLPFETTTSMHNDFKNQKTNTEFESITGYIVNESIKNNLLTPNFSDIYKVIKNGS